MLSILSLLILSNLNVASPASAPPRPARAGHNFCKPCLDSKYGGIADEVDTGAITGRSMRVRKTLKPCPTCKADIMQFMQSARVNHEMTAVIRKLQEGVERAKAEAAKAAAEGGEDEDEEEEAAEGAEEAEEAEEAQPEQQEQAAAAAPAPTPAAAAAAAQAAESNKTTATDASGATTGVKDSALADHQVPNSANGPAAPPAAPAAAVSKQGETGAWCGLRFPLPPSCPAC